MICAREWLTGNCYQHGDGSEGSCEALAAHEDGAVLLRQQTHQTKQTALQHRAERCGERRVLSFNTDTVLPSATTHTRLTVDEPDRSHGN